MTRPTAPLRGEARRPARLAPAWVVGIALAAVALAAVLSLTIGVRDVPLAAVWDALTAPNTENIEQAAVLARIPTTVTGLVVGAALGVGGALMQGMARNPLADPGLLGVNAGASLFVVLGMSLLGLEAPLAIVWCALIGAAVAVLVGYGAASASPAGATPVTLALAGAAVAAIAASVISAILITDESTLENFRFWQIGSLTAGNLGTIAQLAGFLGVGAVVALVCASGLNGLALGDDVARGLGIRVGVVRGLAALAAVLLCGTATAIAGPIGFVGLAVPHAVRLIAGSDYRLVVPLSAFVGAAFLLVCDVIGRLIARPGLLEVGIVTAVVGAPIFIVLLQRRTAVGL
ncbi:FecCD family ABC transporter permease [Leucobacter chromiireducens]|uniref:FecCD family ABC transporter permease n=1 Tax=Leucobacter chromiireducens TaxID=283877 RepID=UPI000F62D8FB|nr:iron ABC transporter permease [Leucobacter chromiireducens]